MIPKSAVKAFLARPRDDHRWIKDVSGEELDECLDLLWPRPRLFPKARMHQKAAFLLGVLMPRFGFWIDMGGGKTLLSLELLRYWWDCGKLRRALILVTSDKAYLTWEAQIARFGIDVPYVVLDGSSEQKWAQLEGFDKGFVIVHYPGLVSMLTSAVKEGRKTRWVPDADKIKRFGIFEGIVADESTRLGNHNSLTYQLVSVFAKQSFAFYALAGRPFGRDPALLWPQYQLIDGGETFGETLGMFRAALFTSSTNYAIKNLRIRKHVKEYKFDKRKMGTLTRLIQHRSITYASDEFPDMPPIAVTAARETVKLPEEAAVYFSRLVKQIVAAKGDYAMMNNVFLRMRQLSSGFLALRSEEVDECIEIEFDQNPKLDRLRELLEEMPEGRQAVIFYEFTHSGRQLMELLEELRLAGVWLWSGTKNPTLQLKEFIGGKRSAAVVNNRVGAYSLDGLQVANYCFFYESPVSVIDREQAERRIRRDGQKRHVFQYDLIVKGTADERILQFHEEGRDLYKALVRTPEKIFRG